MSFRRRGGSLVRRVAIRRTLTHCALSRAWSIYVKETHQLSDGLHDDVLFVLLSEDDVQTLSDGGSATGRRGCGCTWSPKLDSSRDRNIWNDLYFGSSCHFYCLSWYGYPCPFHYDSILRQHKCDHRVSFMCDRNPSHSRSPVFDNHTEPTSGVIRSMIPSTTLSIATATLESLHHRRVIWMPHPTPSNIAAAALDHWEHRLPGHKGKPRPHEEWTVYAALVATTGTCDDSDNKNTTTTVLSCATGTKCTAVCTGPSSFSSFTADAILRDSHAEVLARRGLQRVLWHEILLCDAERGEDDNHHDAKEGQQRFRLLSRVSKYGRYRLRDDVQLHLYVSDSPCGDASIYSLNDTSSPPPTTTNSSENSLVPTSTKDHNNNNGVQFTGAKVIVSPATQVSIAECGTTACLPESTVARERVQLVGRLRTKSGRSNLRADQRSTSLSCSDKLVRWSVLGLQGRALLAYLVEPIRLSSVVVSRDVRNERSINKGQWEALKRAVHDRAAAVKYELQKEMHEISELNSLRIPSVHIVDQVFAPGKACSEHAKETVNRKRKHDGSSSGSRSPPKLSPTGVCLNWNLYDDIVELTVGARGILQGKKPKTDRDVVALASRLSRHGMWKLARGVSRDTSSYADAKSRDTRLTDWRRIVFQRGPLAGWLVSGNDKVLPAEKEATIPKVAQHSDST